ncbi:MAG TPA: YggS family pyridoxal phosphate-dependent enzyme [Thermohalobaculum sp.]|nr:YggS family pyridoxal phosphate-dependent enzyme [Thermohalobaculum sp.]
MSGLEDVRDRIAAAARAAGRDPAEVTLVGVSKKQPEERVRAVLDAGHRVFGENRVQEAAERWGPLREDYPDVTLHLVGPLQSNKTADAARLFDVIESVDRLKIARRLADAFSETGRPLPCYVQVNTGDEKQKAGATPDETDVLVEECRSLGLDIRGLMCIPPEDEEPALHFALLAKIAERNGLSGLSMGMSGDFETAVRLGATVVRVGSALFGERDDG